MSKLKATEVITPEFRVSFPNLKDPRGFNGGEPKFSITMLFDKKTDLSTIKAAIGAAAKAKWGDDQKNWPKNITFPLKDGNLKAELDGYPGTITLGANSKNRPQTVSSQRIPMNPEELYAGCYAKAYINAFAYETKTDKGAVLKRGVSFGLNAVQKIRDGKNFSGRKDADEVFEAVEDGSDNPANYEDAAPAAEDQGFSI